MHHRYIYFLSFVLFLFSCQYFNAFFNAESSFDDAIKEITRVNAGLSDRAGVYSFAGQSEIPSGAKKNLQLSIIQAWKVIELYSDSADYADDAMFLIGRANFFLGVYPKSIESFSDLIDNYVKSEFWQESWLWLSDSYLANKDTIKALNTLEQASLKEFDSETEIKLLTRRGSIAISRNQHKIAINYYRQALSLATDDYLIVSIRLLLAKSFHETGDYDNALVNASIAYDDNEDDELTRLALRQIILTYIAKNDIIYSLKWIEEGRSDFDNYQDFGWYELQRGKLFLNRGNWVEAKEQWLQVIEDYPRTDEAAEAAYNISEYFRLETGQYDSAHAYILKIPSDAWSNDAKKASYLKKWKKMLQQTVDLQNDIKNDSLILAKAKSDFAFYSNPENFSILLQEVQIELEKKEGNAATQTKSNTQSFKRSTDLTQTPEEADDLEEYFNTDSLTSILGKIKIIKNDSLNFTARDSAIVDSLTNISTIIQNKLFKKKRFNYTSLNAVTQNYKESLFKLAELMLIEYEDYLTAQVYYRDYLNIFKDDTTNRDRALFALGYIDWRNGRDPYKIKYFEEILDLYPESPSASKVYLVRGIKIIDEEAEDIAEFNKKYHMAQNLYYDGFIDSSILVLSELRRKSPTKDHYAKVILMEAFIYKNYWKNVDSLYSRYHILATEYSDSPYFSLIKREYLAIKEHREYLKSLDTVLVVLDSLADSSLIVEQLNDSTSYSETDTTVVSETDSTIVEEEKIAGQEIDSSKVIRMEKIEKLEELEKPKKSDLKGTHEIDVD